MVLAKLTGVALALELKVGRHSSPSSSQLPGVPRVAVAQAVVPKLSLRGKGCAFRLKHNLKREIVQSSCITEWGDKVIDEGGTASLAIHHLPSLGSNPPSRDKALRQGRHH